LKFLGSGGEIHTTQGKRSEDREKVPIKAGKAEAARGIWYVSQESRNLQGLSLGASSKSRREIAEGGGRPSGHNSTKTTHKELAAFVLQENSGIYLPFPGGIVK